MTTAAEILTELSRRGIAVRVDGESIRLRPKSALDDELLARVREHKPEILAALSTSLTTCAASCYEIEPRKWIHRPWDSCKTVITAQTAKPAWKVGCECWHCKGSGKCLCIACCDSWTGEAGQCVSCRGTGKGWTWVQ